MGFKENKNEWLPLPIDEVEGNPYITTNNPGWQYLFDYILILIV